MIDTQEKNLPAESEILMEETGELETSQDPELMPVKMVSKEKLDANTPKKETVPEVDTGREIANVPTETVSEAAVVTEEKASETEVFPDDTISETEVITNEALDPEPALALALEPEPALEPALSLGLDPESEFEQPVDEEPEEEMKVAEEETGGHVEEPLVEDDLSSFTKLELLNRLQLIVEDPQKYVHQDAEVLKRAYYRIRRAETDALKSTFLEGGGAEQDFVMPTDDTEAQLKSLMAEYKQKQSSMLADEERQKESNLILKQHLIERLKILTESHDDFNKRYNEFRDIQRKWKEIKQVPQEYSKELWRNYQLYNERFYDLVKINNQFRDYDYKKNLEMKTVLCETVERLATEADVISAFHQLQKIHQQWREIGHVAKEYRDPIWDRFKLASTTISKRHQTHFEDLKGQEEKNLEIKEAICKELETIDFNALKTLKDWERKTEKVMALQTKWRSIGFATKKQNVKIFDRFRAASDHYFNKKSEFYKSMKKEIDRNIEMKKALVEKAESMKNSVDWKETTKGFIEIQNEWKKIGPVGRKYSDTLWKQFIASCDYFFERKNKESSSQKSEEHENLEAKRALIEKIKSIDENLPEEEALALFRGYLSDWNSVGYVPFKEKDRLHKTFRDVVDKQFDRLKVNERDRRIQQFRSSLTEVTGPGKTKLYNERDKLMRTYDRMKIDLQTYENNVGFISSKGGGGLLKEMDRKIARLREDMEVVVKKIEAIDENLEF